MPTATTPMQSQYLCDVGRMPAHERKALADKWGFRTIGEELPEGVKLTDIVRTLPKEVFQKDHMRAWLTCLTSLIAMPASLWLIAVSPPWLLPLAWFISGTAFTGWFVVGHDCGHRSFHRNKLVEDVVGNFFFAPLLYPFEPWRIKHNQHHTYTNKLEEDTAWHPVMKQEVDDMNKSPAGGLIKAFLGSPLKLWASIFHWLIWHFDARKFTSKQMPAVLASWASCAAFAGIALPALVMHTGWWGLVKFWVMPWLGYHFWMSTFTIVHHTAPHIPFKAGGDWDAAKAQLSGTVHCDFPRWIEFLTHDISWHVPHHIASNIPWYNLRKATASLRANWGQYMTEADFNPRLVKTIVNTCHVYDEENNYVSFDWRRDEPYFAWQRKVTSSI